MAPRTAIGPNGCVNSFWPKENIRNAISTPNRRTNPPETNNEKKVAILKDNGAKFIININETNNIKNTSTISCKWF